MDASDDLLVTVIVSSYNRPELLVDALASIAAQEASPWVEVLVADDHSDPLTQRGIAAGLLQLAQCPHVRRVDMVQPPEVPSVVQRQLPGRCGRCINVALREAKGRYVVFLPDDDFLTPRSLAARVAFMEAHPAADVCFGKLISCMSPVPVRGREHPHCHHRTDAFFSNVPVASIANRADHGQVMVRRWEGMPEWPEQSLILVQGEGDTAPRTIKPLDYQPVDRWLATYDCPDAGWFARLAEAGVTSFHPVPVPVIVKRYHRFGHKTNPAQRE